MIRVHVQKRTYSYTARGCKKTGWGYYARYRDAAGKDRWESLSTQDAHLARNKAAERERQLNAGAAGRGPLTWGAAWSGYKALVKNVKSDVTLKAEARAWKFFWRSCPASRLDRCTPAHVAQWRDALLDEHSARTVRDYLGRCSTVYAKLAKAQAYHGGNPFLAVDLPRNDTAVKEWLRPAEVEALLSAALDESRDLYLFCVLGVHFGLRPKEIFYCRWSWFDWGEGSRRGFLRVPRKEGAFEPKNKRERFIPMAAILRERLLPYRGAAGSLVVWPMEPWLVESTAPRIDVRRRFAALLKRAGIERPASPYTLRHTFGARLAQASVPGYDAMNYMGHRSMATFQIYGHLDPGRSEAQWME